MLVRSEIFLQYFFHTLNLLFDLFVGLRTMEPDKIRDIDFRTVPVPNQVTLLVNFSLVTIITPLDTHDHILV